MSTLWSSQFHLVPHTTHSNYGTGSLQVLLTSETPLTTSYHQISSYITPWKKRLTRTMYFNMHTNIRRLQKWIQKNKLKSTRENSHQQWTLQKKTFLLLNSSTLCWAQVHKFEGYPLMVKALNYKISLLSNSRTQQVIITLDKSLTRANKALGSSSSALSFNKSMASTSLSLVPTVINKSCEQHKLWAQRREREREKESVCAVSKSG